MVSRKFRKKPAVIEAMQNEPHKRADLVEFVPQEFLSFEGDNAVISAPDGRWAAKPGDWVIKGVKGEFYPCPADVFEATYEEVTE